MSGIPTRRSTRATRHVDQNTGQRTTRTVTTRKRTDTLRTKPKDDPPATSTTAPPARKRKALGDNTNAEKKRSTKNVKDKAQPKAQTTATIAGTTNANRPTPMKLVVEIPLRKRRIRQQPGTKPLGTTHIADSGINEPSDAMQTTAPPPDTVVGSRTAAGDRSHEFASHVEATDTISASPFHVTHDLPLEHELPKDEPPAKRRRSNRRAAPEEQPESVTTSIPAPAQEEDNPFEIGLRPETAKSDFGPVSVQPWDDLDAEDENDPLMVAEYVVEIFGYIKELELQTMPSSTYMNAQPDLEWHMRGILMDWLIEIHSTFRLLPETLFLATNLIDRFLSLRVVSLVKLQLVGITGLLIATKYEEVVPPSIRDILRISDSGYTEQDILSAEKYMLRTLRWDLSYPSPLNWLRRASKADEYDVITRTMAKFLIEISVVDERLLKYTPSILAAAGLWLARLIMGRAEWNANLEYYSGYPEAKLIRCANVMINFLLQPITHKALWKKYSMKKYLKCAMYAQKWAEVRWPPDSKRSSEEDGDESGGPVEVDLAAALPILREQNAALETQAQ